jgi:hypothetical protein
VIATLQDLPLHERLVQFARVEVFHDLPLSS